MPDTRLIERWLPIAEIGVESTRERTPMTPFPAPNRLHVWWARRPLVASRAAILASLLPEDADRDRFLHVIGIHGDPVKTRRRLDEAKRTGENLGLNPYGYQRAFGHVPDPADRRWMAEQCGDLSKLQVVDPTAGGGTIPFEAERLGLAATANDLNPVAVLILRATIDWPARHGAAVLDAFNALGVEFLRRAEPKYADVFPAEPEGVLVDGYLWARTVTCPYCDGRVPLSPNWRLALDGTGVRLVPAPAAGPGTEGRVCGFEIVGSAREQSPGTMARGDGTCPFPDCGRIIDGGAIKAQAQAGQMGEQLFAVVCKRRETVRTKTGRAREKWVRGYRAPRREDDDGAALRAALDEKLAEWDAFDLVPNESYDDMYCDRSKIYGVQQWRDLFSPRQLLCHGTSVEVFREMLDADREAGKLDEVRQAAYGYLALTLDTLLNYNNRSGRWDNTTGRVRSIFDRHDFAFVWSYAEMAPLVTGVGYDWAIEKTAKCIRELVALVRPEADGGRGGTADLLDQPAPDRAAPPPVTITCKSGDSLDHLAAGSVDAVVMDPPYYDNVMYAELSDFFYVWLKRTAGRVFPELFRRRLTDKDAEAVANPARVRAAAAGAGEGAASPSGGGRARRDAGSPARGAGLRALAGRDYQERMAAIFAECRRVLKPDGILTLMFTHKATGAWDALTAGLIEAGFAITASWPVNTEAGGSLHIRNKAAANSTVFLVCRPRAAADPDAEAVYWEDVEPRVREAVRRRVQEFQDGGIRGVDLYLAAFGPALEEFSRHWPVRRGTPRERPKEPGRRQTPLPAEPWDPYAATPEDALDAARREVKGWRLSRLTHLQPNVDLDPATAFFVLAWDAFRAPAFAYDEALRLARAVGIDPDREVAGRLAEKKGGDLVLWDSARRAAKGALGPADGSRGLVDALHHAAHLARTSSLAAARDLLEGLEVHRDPRFFAALEAVLEVLPAGVVTGVALSGDAAAAGSDFEALYHLYRLAWRNEIDEPDQLRFWRADGGG